MNIYFSGLKDHSSIALLAEFFEAAEPRIHTQAEKPDDADLILLVGTWSNSPDAVRNHPLVQRFPEKVFSYNDDDFFLPLLPGVYTSARTTLLSFLGRYANHTYLTQLSSVRNAYVRPMEMKKTLLFSFAGGSTAFVRKRIFKQRFQRSDIKITNTSTYYHWDASQPDREKRQQEYVETIASSHYVLCPRGGGAGSIRLFEVMEMGVAPVLLSDGYLLPEGPRWEEFLIQIPESKIDQLEQILAAKVSESSQRGKLAREAWETFFSGSKVFNGIIETCIRVKKDRKVPEQRFRRIWVWMIAADRIRRGFRSLVRKIILSIFRFFRLKFIYDLNR